MGYFGGSFGGYLTGYFSYILWMLLAILISLFAQIMVNSAYSKNSKIQNSRRITGAQAAKLVLENNGVYNVNIMPVSGKLTDHFDPRNNTIYLSEGVFNATTVAAVGIASHEAGHAVQHATGYLPNKIRSVMVPITGIGSRVGWLLIIAGLAFSGFTYYSTTVNPQSASYQIGGALITAGIVLYSTSLLFTLITLPVEFNASNRALTTIRETGLLEGDEYRGARSTLNAAAMTYVAAALTALLQLIRIILVSRRRR